MISAVIAIRNCAQYLYKVLASLHSQTYRNFEAILIDAASMDGSADICREYTDRDPRFHYFFRNSADLSDARNEGMRRANGDYIIFIDPYDCIEPEYFAVLREPMTHHAYSFTQCSIMLASGGSLLRTLQAQRCSCSGKEYRYAALTEERPSLLRASTVAKLYAKSFLERCAHPFRRAPLMLADRTFQTEALLFCDAVCSVDALGYRYRCDTPRCRTVPFVQSPEAVEASILCGNRCAEARQQMIRLEHLQSDPLVAQCHQLFLAELCITNAQQIEQKRFTKAEKEQLYALYLNRLELSSKNALRGFSPAERLILWASAKKKPRAVSRCCKLQKRRRDTP